MPSAQEEQTCSIQELFASLRLRMADVPRGQGLEHVFDFVKRGTTSGARPGETTSQVNTTLTRARAGGQPTKRTKPKDKSHGPQKKSQDAREKNGANADPEFLAEGSGGKEKNDPAS